MSIKSLSRHTLSSLVLVQRSVANQSNFDLGKQMKLLNDKKQFKKSIELFDKYTKSDTAISSSFIITQALKACAQLRDVHRGETIHRLIASHLIDNDYILSSLIHLYMQCGDMVRAISLFDMTTNKTLGMYGAMMKGYIKNNQAKKAIDLFHEIKSPDPIIITILFNACAALRTNESLSLLKKVYKEMPQDFYSNPYLLTSLLDAFIKCGDVSNAELFFDRISNKVLQMYGVMMKGYIENNQAKKAIDLFHEIKNPDPIIITILFNACAALRTNESLTLVKKVYKEMPKSFHSDSYLLASLLDAFMKCGDVSNAELLFDKIPHKILSMYGAIMKGYIENNQANKAIDLFREIKDPNDVIFILLFNSCAQLGTMEALNLTKTASKIIPKSFYSNVRLLTSLLDALVKCNDLTYAQLLFDTSIQKHVGMYAVMMNGYNKEANPLKTLNLFYQMKDKNHVIIYLHVVKALSQIGDYKLSQSIIEQIPNDFLLDSQLQAALIDVWGKSGSIDKAKEIFDKISRPNQYQCAAIINAYGLNGMGIQAIEIYRQIPLDLIDEITLICILNACSHSGLVQDARSIFENISVKTIPIYTTMIDCFSRAALFQEAENLLEEYERYHPPSLPMYMALLSGARNQMNANLSQQIYDRMNNFFPRSDDLLVSASTLLANVYGSIGDIDKASDIRIQLSKSSVKKKIGLSWTVVDGQVYQFRAHDVDHPRSKEIYAEAERISAELVEHGHQYDSSWITRPLSQDETVATVLCGHSERLAIAWNFVLHPNASRIQITKNLRVCGDCHRATKLIAAIRQCEIIVRDANRMHHFYKNGQCSCNDYF